METSTHSAAGRMAAGVFAFVLVVAGLFLGMLLGLGCSENLHPNTDRTRVCEATTGSEARLVFWLIVLSPAALFLASQLVPWLRRHWVLSAIAIVLAMSVGWTYLLLVVSSNVGDTTISS